MLLMSFTAPSYAAGLDELCPPLATLAMNIMTSRQEGVPLEILKPIVDQIEDKLAQELTLAILLDAYATPLYNTDEFKNLAITEFGNTVSVACYSSEL